MKKLSKVKKLIISGLLALSLLSGAGVVSQEIKASPTPTPTIAVALDLDTSFPGHNPH
jgi:hypothetical protein